MFEVLATCNLAWSFGIVLNPCGESVIFLIAANFVRLRKKHIFDVLNIYITQRLRCAGHIVRMPDIRTTKIVYMSKPMGT